jgi:hypothetical protein
MGVSTFFSLLIFQIAVAWAGKTGVPRRVVGACHQTIQSPSSRRVYHHDSDDFSMFAAYLEKKSTGVTAMSGFAPLHADHMNLWVCSLRSPFHLYAHRNPPFATLQSTQATFPTSSSGRLPDSQ